MLIKIKKNFLKNKKIVIGIDFGTTFCLFSTCIDGKIYNFSDEKNNFFFPSIINFSSKKILYSWKALKKIKEDPKNTITSIKRFIGLSYSEIKKKYPNLPYKITKDSNNSVIFNTNYGKISISEIIQKLLNFFVQKIIEKYEIIIVGAVITVPAYFNNLQKNEIRKIAKKININILRLINEPTSAAIAYGLEKKVEGTICIYDLGGGTFDVSILRIKDSIFEVLAIGGNNKLGGDDIDLLIANYLYKKLKIKETLSSQKFKKLLILSEKIKILLSKKNDTVVIFEKYKTKFSIKEFNELIFPIIQKTIQIVQKTLIDSKKLINQIKEIILVGGSTYIPSIQKEIKKFFKRKPLCTINPSKVVSLGAGLHANFLFYKNQNKIHSKFLLLDVVPMSIGIELLGGIMEVMIYKNTTVPTESKKKFTTFKDNQTGFKINVFQGEDQNIHKCQLLTNFTIKGLPPKPAGCIKITIIFQIDVDGLLNIIVKEKKLKLCDSIKIDTIYGKEKKSLINFKK